MFVGALCNTGSCSIGATFLALIVHKDIKGRYEYPEPALYF